MPYMHAPTATMEFSEGRGDAQRTNGTNKPLQDRRGRGVDTADSRQIAENPPEHSYLHSGQITLQLESREFIAIISHCTPTRRVPRTTIKHKASTINSRWSRKASRDTIRTSSGGV